MAGQQGTRKTKEVKSTTDAAPPPPPPPSKKPTSVFQSSSISVSPTPNYASIYSTATQPMESSPQGQPTMSYLAPKFERGQAATQIKAEEQKQRHAAEEAAAAEQQRLAAQAAAEQARAEQTRIENERVAAESETARLLYEQAGVTAPEHPMEKFWQDATVKETKKVKDGTSFWGGGKVQTTQESERQIQVLLADIHIQNTTGDIEGIRTEIRDLRSLMDQERARLVNEKDKGFDAWNEAVLLNESSVYKQSKFRIEELQASLFKKEKYLESETLKKEEWEALSLTEKADVAFSSGISFEDPMQKPADITSPVKTKTLEYVDKVPDLNVQKPDKGRPDKDSVFGAFDSLKTKSPDYLGAVLDPFPEASAVLSEELAATDTTGEMKTIDDWMEAQKIAERDKTGQFAEELVIPTSPVNELRPDIFQIYQEEQEKAPEGMIFQGFDDYGKPSYVQVGKRSVVSKVDRWAAPGVTIDLSTGKIRHMLKGKEIKEADRYIITRKTTPLGIKVIGKDDEGNLITEHESVGIARQYAYQAQTKYYNELQGQRFDLIKEGEISVGSFIALQAEGGGDVKQMTRHFAEIGVPLTAPIKSVSIHGQTKLQPGEERTYIKDEEAFKTTGVDLRSLPHMAQDDMDRINMETKKSYLTSWVESEFEEYPNVKEWTIMKSPSDTIGDEVGVTVSRSDVLGTMLGYAEKGEFGVAAGLQPADEQLIINPAKDEEYAETLALWQHPLSVLGSMYVGPEGTLTPKGLDYLRDRDIVITKGTAAAFQFKPDVIIEEGVTTFDTPKKSVVMGGIPPFAVGAILAPTLAMAQDAELKKFDDAPAKYIFENRPDVYTTKGQAADAAGEIPAYMTYSEKVDAGYVVMDGIVDETKYNLSRGVMPILNIFKAGGQVATGDSEGDYKISEYTVLERTIGGLMEQVQHSFDQVFDENLQMGTGGKKEWQEGEHKARPWDSYAIIDSETGEVVVTDAEQRARTDLDWAGGKMDVLQKEMTQPEEGQEWQGHGQAIFSRIESNPVGFIAELPAEAALFVIPVPLRVPLIAGLKIGAAATSGAAKTLLKAGGFTTETAIKVQRLQKITDSVRHQSSYIPMPEGVQQKLFQVARVTPDVVQAKARDVLYANISFDAGKSIVKSNFQKAVSAQWDKVPQSVKDVVRPVVAKVNVMGGLEESKIAQKVGMGIKIVGTKEKDYVPEVPRSGAEASKLIDVRPTKIDKDQVGVQMKDGKPVRTDITLEVASEDLAFKQLGAVPITGKKTLPTGTDFYSYGAPGGEAVLTPTAKSFLTLTGDDLARSPMSTSLSANIKRALPSETGITKYEQALWGGAPGSAARQDVRLGVKEMTLGARFDEVGFYGVYAQSAKIESVEQLIKNVWGTRSAIAKLDKGIFKTETKKKRIKALKKEEEALLKQWKDIVGVRQVSIEPGLTGVGEWVTYGAQRGIRITSQEFDELGIEMFVTKERIGKSYKKDVKVYTFGDKPTVTKEGATGWRELVGQPGWITKDMAKEIKKTGKLTLPAPTGKSSSFQVKVDKSLFESGRVVIQPVEKLSAQEHGMFMQILRTEMLDLKPTQKLAVESFRRTGGKIEDIPDIDLRRWLQTGDMGTTTFIKHEADLTAEILKYTQMTPTQFDTLIPKGYYTGRGKHTSDVGKWFKANKKYILQTVDATPLEKTSKQFDISTVKRLFVEHLKEKKETPRLWLREGGTDLMTDFQKEYAEQLFHKSFTKQPFFTEKRGALQEFYDAIDMGVPIKQAVADTPPNLKTIAVMLKEGVSDRFGRRISTKTRVATDEKKIEKTIYTTEPEEEVSMIIGGKKEVLHARIPGQEFKTPEYGSDYSYQIQSTLKEQPLTSVVLTEKQLKQYQQFRTFYSLFGDASTPRMLENVAKTEAKMNKGLRDIEDVHGELLTAMDAKANIQKILKINLEPDARTDIIPSLTRFIKDHSDLNTKRNKLDTAEKNLSDTSQTIRAIHSEIDQNIVATAQLETKLKFRIDVGDGKFEERMVNMPPKQHKGSYTIDEQGFAIMNARIEKGKIVYEPEFTPMKKPRGEPLWTDPKSAAEQRVDDINKRIKQLRDKVAVIKEGEKIIPGTSVAKKQLKENLDEITSLKAELKAKKPKIGTDMEDEILGSTKIDDTVDTKGILNPDYHKHTSLRYDMKSLKARLSKVEKTQSKQYAIKSDMEKVYDNEFNRLISEGDPEVHMQKIIKEMDNKEYIKSDGKILQGWDEKTGEIVYFGTRQQPFGNMKKWKITQKQMLARGHIQIASYEQKFVFHIKGKDGKWRKTSEPLGVVVNMQSSMPKGYWQTAPAGTYRKKPVKIKLTKYMGTPNITTIGGRPRDPVSHYQRLLEFGHIDPSKAPKNIDDVIFFSEVEQEAMGDIISKGYFSTVGLLERTRTKQAGLAMEIGDINIRQNFAQQLHRDIVLNKNNLRTELSYTDKDWSKIKKLKKQISVDESRYGKLVGSDPFLRGMQEGDVLSFKIGKMKKLVTSIEQMEQSLKWTTEYMSNIGMAKKLVEPAGYGKKAVQEDIWASHKITRLKNRLEKLQIKQVTFGAEADEAKTKLAMLMDNEKYAPPSTFMTSVEMTTGVGMTQNLPAWSQHIMGTVKGMPSIGNYYKKQWDVYDIGRGGAFVFKPEKLSLTGKVITRFTKKWSPVPEVIAAGRRAQGKMDDSGKIISLTEDELKSNIDKLLRSAVDLDKAKFPIKKLTGKFKKTSPYDKTIGAAAITKYHVRQVEKEIGYSLEPFAPDIISALRRTQTTGELGTNFKGWGKDQFDAWEAAILDRPRSEKIMKAVLKTQVGKDTATKIETFTDSLRGIRARYDTPTIDPTGKKIEDLPKYMNLIAKHKAEMGLARAKMESFGIDEHYKAGYYSTKLKKQLPDESWEDWLITQKEVVDLKMPGRQANIDPDGGYTDLTNLKEQLDIDWMFGSIRQRTFDPDSPAYRPGTTLPFRSTSAWQKFQLLINTEISTTAFRDVLNYWKVMGTGSTFGNLTSRKHIAGTLDVMKSRIDLSRVAQDAPGMSSGKVMSDNVSLLLHQFVTRPLHTIKTGFRRDVATDVKFGKKKEGTAAYASQAELWNVHISNMSGDYYGPRASAEVLGVHEVVHQVLAKHGLRRSTFDWDVLEYGGLGGNKAYKVPSFGIPGREDFPLRTAKKLGLSRGRDPISNIPDYPITTGDYMKIAAEQLAAKTERYPAGTIIGGKDVGGQLTPQTIGDMYGGKYIHELTEKGKAVDAFKTAQKKLAVAEENLKQTKDDLYGSTEWLTKKVKKVVEEGTYPTGERKFSVKTETVEIPGKIKQGLLYKDPALVDQFLINQIRLAKTGPTRDFLKELQAEMKSKTKPPGPDIKTGTGKTVQKTVKKPGDDDRKTPAQQYLQRQYQNYGYVTQYYPTYQTVAYPIGTTLPKTIMAQEAYAAQEPTSIYSAPEILQPDVVQPAPLPKIEILQPPTIAQYNPFKDISTEITKLSQPLALGSVQVQTPIFKQTLSITPSLAQIPVQRIGQKTPIPRIVPTITEQMPFMPPRTVPYPPGGIAFPGWWLDAQRKKPRKQRIRKRRRRKLWWDVPFQPLGEPWAAKEYVVFTGGEPKKIKKKEKKKGLDDWLNFSFND